MHDPITQQLEQFMAPERAAEHVAFVRMASVLIKTNSEAEALKARVAELEAARPDELAARREAKAAGPPGEAEA